MTWNAPIWGNDTHGTATFRCSTGGRSRGWLWREYQIGPQGFQSRRTNTADDGEAVNRSKNGFAGVIALRLLTVCDNRRGEFFADVGNGGYLGRRRRVGIKPIFQFRGPVSMRRQWIGQTNRIAKKSHRHIHQQTASDRRYHHTLGSCPHKWPVRCFSLTLACCRRMNFFAELLQPLEDGFGLQQIIHQTT